MKQREPFQKFYSTTAWKQCREGYKRYVGGLCERCLAEGTITPGVIVHHKTYLTPELACDPSVALNYDNLELLCWHHHEVEHKARMKKRFEVDGAGRVTAID